MAFYLDKEREADVVSAYQRYQQYLHEHRSQFPPKAFSLGTSDWYYSPSDHRCPHDAWLEDLSISETPSQGNRLFTKMRLRLLGAYHDGHIELNYPQVFGYMLNGGSCECGLGDWRYDEFRMSPEGQLIHEIEWAGSRPGVEGARWIITASDLEFRWIPKK